MDVSVGVPVDELGDDGLATPNEVVVVFIMVLSVTAWGLAG